MSLTVEGRRFANILTHRQIIAIHVLLRGWAAGVLVLNFVLESLGNARFFLLFRQSSGGLALLRDVSWR